MSPVIELGTGVHAAFTERRGAGGSAAPFDTLNLGLGVPDDPAAVLENRETAARELGFDPDRVVWMRQVHSREIAVATEPGLVGPADGVVADRSDLVLAALAADCLPVLAWDGDTNMIGAAHAGRKGTVSGVVPALLAEMIAMGAGIAGITVVLGPAICGTCYEVPSELRQEVVRAVPEGGSWTKEGTAAVDMRAAVMAQLRRAGVTSIVDDDRCTLEDPRFFSHRRESVTGRFAGYIWRD